MDTEILNIEEKEFLSFIINPFKKKVVYISKEKARQGKREYIYIQLSDSPCQLPCFPEGELYKNMEVKKHYTLNELGL